MGNSKEPTLVVLAAGIGSRFGGEKQVAPVDDAGQAILDYTLYDAARAGFAKAVCVVRPGAEEGFRAGVGARAAKRLAVEYAGQTLSAMLPAGFAPPEGRERPWGTAHALLCAAPLVRGPFATVNADDFYGRAALEQAAAFLREGAAPGRHALVAYDLRNTLSEHGSVSRGVCDVDGGGFLRGVVERTRIEVLPRGADGAGDAKGAGGADATGGTGGAGAADAAGGAGATCGAGDELGIAYDAGGGRWAPLPGDAAVSLNLWAFHDGVLDEFRARFRGFLERGVPADPLRAEYFLPSVPDALIREGRASFRVLRTRERWHGVTYREDLPGVRDAIAALRAAGAYPARL